MIRIWNYNKSRLHSSRGVRELEILLDSVPIFVGEIRRAPGLLTDPEQACEHILFTQDERVLQVIEENDWLPAHLPLDDVDEEAELSTAEDPSKGALSQDAVLRPPTADPQRQRSSGTGTDGRPITAASTEQRSGRAIACESITLAVLSTWGDAFYVGLTALELLDAALEPITIGADQIDASPRDLNDLEEVGDDPRTIDKLLDRVTCTTDETHMWMSPFVKNVENAPRTAKESQAGLLCDEGSRQCNLIRIDFGGHGQRPFRRDIAGFNIWNYNKNVEDTCRGVKEFSVYCDEKYIATFLCRKAPGHVRFDFKQLILLDQPPLDQAAPNVRRTAALSSAPRMPSRSRDRNRAGSPAPPVAGESASRENLGRRRTPSRERASSSSNHRMGSAPGSLVLQQQYETPVHPCGFVFRFVLVGTWSDVHYIGLDGIELCDLSGASLRPKRAHSNHGSVRNLKGMENDIRTEENLCHGHPGKSGRMWLAPLVRGQPNTVELFFDEPTQIAFIRLWNYSRTPGRGARDIEFYVDDLLVYQGILRQAEATSQDKSCESVLFTTNAEIVASQRQHVYVPTADELFTCIDDGRRVDQKRPLGPPTGLERPMTALVH